MFNTSISDQDEGVKFTSDTKMVGNVDLLEGQEAIQRDLDRLDQWPKTNCTSFSKAKCYILHLNYDNPWQCHRLSEEWLESCSA